MKTASLLLTAGALAFSAHAADPRQALAAGASAYRAGQFGPAQAAFAAAATNATAHQLDPAIARYNEAAAQYRLGQMDSAAERLAEALRTGDLRLQQQAWFNRGNALLGCMAAQRQQGKIEAAQKLTAEAATHFEQAIMLDAADEDAKVNYELCLRLQQELEKQRQQQEQQQNQQKQDQQKQDQPQQDQQSQKKNDQPQHDSGQQQQQQQNQPPSGQQPKAGQDQQQPKAAVGEKKADAMTPEEAAMLLNAMRQEEQSNRDKLRVNIGPPEPVEKDW